MTVSDIKDALHNRYYNFDYELSESYIFQHDWETDFFVRSKSGYSYEIEIKLSRSDYRADFKKPKHEIFANIGNPYHIINRGEGRAWIGQHRGSDGKYHQEFAPCTNIRIIDNSKVVCPNKFYYAVPHGLISPLEVPRYAGLIYVTSSWNHEIVKEAPYLHKRKLDLTSVLLSKFYHECIRQRHTIRYYKSLQNGEKKT